MHTFVLAGGCFWCLDAVYRTLRGVKDVVSGYTGGTTVFPSYEAVCTGTTGHAEAVAVTFDPDVIPDEVILDVFFSLHDPRQLNRQGNDVGTQYRSAMYYSSDEEKELFETARDRASSSSQCTVCPVASARANGGAAPGSARTKPAGMSVTGSVSATVGPVVSTRRPSSCLRTARRVGRPGPRRRSSGQAWLVQPSTSTPR